jgi:hypothetical protein
MEELTIKAYYKAVTTKKNYVIQENISTNFIGYKYLATNHPSNKFEDYNYLVLDTSYYYENLDVLSMLFKDLNNSWTQNCYYYEWDEFLSKYELSNNQYKIIKKLVENN